MKIFLVGHRGTGKTSLLRRLRSSQLFQGLVYDLDEEIEKKIGDIKSYFESEGENSFRKKEIETFKDLYTSSPDLLMVLGAGFDLSQIPENDFVLWIRRDSDSRGRIFLNRPRLIPDDSPMAEFQQKYSLRENGFRHRANGVYTLSEGIPLTSLEEEKILMDIFQRFHQIKNPIQNEKIEDAGLETLAFSDLEKKHSQSYLEVRSDQWSESEILKIQESETGTKKIYSQRHARVPVNLNPDKWLYLDWDLQYGESPWRNLAPEKLILSSHKDEIRQAIQELNSFSRTKNEHLKLCPLVNDWSDLKLGFQWWKEDPQHRSFLPRSDDGRWAWFRLWMKGQQKLNFWRQGPSSVSDQPTLHQWLSATSRASVFAAVLGDPVQHSYSPSFHQKFFSSRNISFLAVPLKENEFDQAMTFLKELGLRFAAVTSPLKKKAFLISKPNADLEKNLEALNTLVWDEINQGWTGFNTDQSAFAQSFTEARQSLSSPVKDEDILVWGGGGTLKMIKTVLPKVHFVKARDGQDELHEKDSPALIIWASPRTSQVQWPPDHWRPELIFDLNYQENSMGLELAQRYQTKYFSGRRMFELQAQHQQKIWSEYL